MIDTEFQRAVYRAVAADVRRHDPTIKLRDAWVWKASRDHWEFHFGKFYWHGRAGGAFDARAKGWAAYMGTIAFSSNESLRDEQK